MDETELIITMQNHLSSAISAPVVTAGIEDERPVPVVVIEDWDTRDLNFNNSAKSGEATGDFDTDGNLEYEKYLTFDFETRIEFLIRDSDEVDANRLKDNVKAVLRLIRENPQSFHDDLKQCKLGSGGNPTFKFTEPKESELMLSARFHGDHTITRTASDTQNDLIDQITETFSFNL